MNILLITMYFAPDTGANATIITELAEGLAQKGHKITVITAFPHYSDNRIAPAYRGKLIQHDHHGSINVYRTYIYVPQNKTSLFGRLLNYVSFNFFSTLVGLFVTRCDVILAPSPPLTIGLTAWVISRLKHIPYVYNVQDIYPDIAIRLGVLKNKNVIRMFSWLEGFVYRGASYITVLSEGFRANLLQKSVPPDKLRIIPNFVNTDFMTPLPRQNSFSIQNKLDNYFVVMYAGNIGLSQRLETLLTAANELGDLPDLRILIVGNGAAKDDLTRLAMKMNLSNVIFLPYQPVDKLSLMYASADASLVIIRQGISFESVPSKTYTIMASGRPIIASVDTDSEIWTMLHKAECGLYIAPEDATKLAQAIRELHNKRELASEMGKKGRAYVVEHHSQQRIVTQYHQLLTELTHTKN
jgi:colanic acid biosynthesis glycosyl transferase WcaI